MIWKYELYLDDIDNVKKLKKEVSELNSGIVTSVTKSKNQFIVKSSLEKVSGGLDVRIDVDRKLKSIYDRYRNRALESKKIKLRPIIERVIRKIQEQSTDDTYIRVICAKSNTNPDAVKAFCQRNNIKPIDLMQGIGSQRIKPVDFATALVSPQQEKKFVHNFNPKNIWKYEESIEEAGLSSISLFNDKDSTTSFIDEVKKGLNNQVPLVVGKSGILGGHDTIFMTVFLEPREKWKNGIAENAQSFRVRVESNGEVTVNPSFYIKSKNPMMAYDRLPVKFRKTTVKNSSELISKLSAFIKLAKDAFRKEGISFD